MVRYFKRIRNLLAGIVLCTTVQAAAPAEKLVTEPTEAPAAAAAPAERFPLASHRLPPPPRVPLRGIYLKPQEAGNIRDVRGVPLTEVLCRAAYHGDCDLVEWALGRGANVNSRLDLKTALYYVVEHFAAVIENVQAVQHNLLLTAELLLKKGASVVEPFNCPRLNMLELLQRAQPTEYRERLIILLHQYTPKPPAQHEEACPPYEFHG